MPISKQQLLQILPNAGQVAGVFVPALNISMNRYQIIGTKRVAAFIAQIGHESGQLKYVKEIWGPTAAQCKLPPAPTAWFMEPVEPNLTERMLNELSKSPATAIKD